MRLQRLPLVALAVLTLVSSNILSGCTTIESGNVGVKSSMAKISIEELGPGLRFFNPFWQSIDEFTAKEVQIDFQDLTPKAQDNLSLQDLDVTVFYRTNPEQIAELRIKYNASHVKDPDNAVWLPAYNMVYRQARDAIYDGASQINSLDMHRERELLKLAIQENLQQKLDNQDPGVFVVSRVVIRSILTDPSIEEAIQLLIENQKLLESKQVEIEIASADAQIEIERARGLAEANRIVAESLTDKYLDHEENMNIRFMAEKGANTILFPWDAQASGSIGRVADGGSSANDRALAMAFLAEILKELQTANGNPGGGL